MKRAYTLTYTWNKAEEADWNCPGLWLVSHDGLSTSPSLSWVPTPAPLVPRYTSNWGKGYWSQGECAVVRDRATLGLAWCLNRARAAITGVCGGSASGAVQISDWCQDRHSSRSSLCWAATPAPVAPALLPPGVRVPVLRAGRAHTSGK